MSALRKDDDATTAVFVIIGAVAIVPLTLAYTVTLYGYALMKLWAWFVVPAFELPPLAFWTACGLNTIVALLKGATKETEEEKGESAGVKIVTALARSTVFVLFALGIGWTIKAVWL